jgi:hypothetical protein
LCFPPTVSASPTSPFPTQWLPRVGSPPFARYYEDAKTSAAHPVSLRIPSGHGYFPASLFLRSLLGPGSRARCAGALVYRFRPLLRLVPEEEVSRISQVPREPVRAFALLFDPGRISAPSPLRRFDAAPAALTTKAPTLTFISRLNHTALAPAPYASCRHHCRRRNVRFRLVASLYRVGFSPTGSL